MAPDETETLQQGVSASPPNPPADDTAESRARGRPTIAELQARKAELDAKEEELKRRELEIELAASEQNLAFRERDIEMREGQVAAGRGSARSGTIRSEELTQPVRGRRYKGGMDMPNKYHIPPQEIPLGTSYQWNTHAIYGQEQRHYSVFMANQGWEPVPASRHPHLAPKDANPNDPIIIDGQILVERPAEWTNEALQEEYDKARGEVAMKEEQLFGTPQGTLPRARANGSNEFIAVNKQIERPEAELPRGNYKYETPGQGGVVIE